jgi:hypothetical protein
MSIQLSKSCSVFLRSESRTVKVSAPLRHRSFLHEVRDNVELGVYHINTALSVLSGIINDTEEQ